MRHRPAGRGVLYPLALQRVRVPLLQESALDIIMQDGLEFNREVETRRVIQQAKDLKEGLHAGATEMSMAQWATPRLASCMLSVEIHTLIFEHTANL